MAELLVELFSEEIPARMQARAADDLKALASRWFGLFGFGDVQVQSYVTPRRLVLTADGLPQKQSDRVEERRGPRIDAPLKALEGFVTALKSYGLTLEDCEKRDTGKGIYYFAQLKQEGSETTGVLPHLLVEIATSFPWPKSMRWGTRRLPWVRPLHSVMCVFNGEAIQGYLVGPGFTLTDEFPAGCNESEAIRVSDITRGHRFLAPQPFTAKSFIEYKDHLRSAYVMLDAAERRETIAASAALLAKNEGLQLKRDEGLLDEVTGLVEWPVPLLGSIDQQFMDVPPEVLTTAMRAHQKYFALQKPDGSLAPRFVVIANMLTEDGGKQVVAGNERVLRARLSDARFFWDQDRKQKLDSRVPSLKDIVFHAKLGTVADKVTRIETLAGELCQYIPGADRDAVRSASLLAKADLVTGMVGEFPELQGIMGRYYALHDGEKREVADAIAEHYSPKGPDDKCPSAPVSVAVALADKIDTLVGFWLVDEKPTGSKDPFALRRAALGIIRIILENRLRMHLVDVLANAEKINQDSRTAARIQNAPKNELVMIGTGTVSERRAGWDNPISVVVLSLLDFFADRFKVALREKGVRHDLIDAVFAVGGEDDLVRLLDRVNALNRFLATDDGRNLLTAYRRASNIVTIEEKKDKTTYGGAVDPALLSQAEEKTLAKVLTEAQSGTRLLLDRDDFVGTMTALSYLRGPVDAFFDKVTVNAEDKGLRANRLKLLSQIRATLGAVADFSRIVEG